MRKLVRILLSLVLVPAILIAFVVVHELGHTVLSRVLGDPHSTFYLVKIEKHSACLGCNIYDQTKLSWSANLVVSLAGLMATQVVALAALWMLGLRRVGGFLRRLLAGIALGFAFLDVMVQVTQGLLYDMSRHTWPTNVDLLDFMLLLQSKTAVSQSVLKGLLFAGSVAYLSGFVWLYRRVGAQQHLRSARQIKTAQASRS